MQDGEGPRLERRGFTLQRLSTLAHVPAGGVLLRRALCPHDPHQVVVIGLCGGHAGSATTAEEYRVQDDEAAARGWGRDFGAFVQAMAEQVASGPARPVGEAVRPWRWSATGDQPLRAG